MQRHSAERRCPVKERQTKPNAQHEATSRARSHSDRAPAIEGLLELQRTAGNRAVSSLLASSASAHSTIQRGVGPSRGVAQGGMEMAERTIAQRLQGRGYQLQPSPYPGMSQIVGTRAHILQSCLGPAYPFRHEIFDLILEYLEVGLELYRGVPKWHRYWNEARAQGRAMPFGAGPPDFDTQRSRFLPFSESADIAAYAAMAESGGSHANRPQVRIEDVEGFRRHNPEEVVGVVIRADVDTGTATDVAFMKPGEVQLGGPVAGEVHQVLRAGENPGWRRREGLSAEV